MGIRWRLAAGRAALAALAGAVAGPVAGPGAAGAAARPAWTVAVQIAVNANGALAETGPVTRTLAAANLAPGTSPAVAEQPGGIEEVAWQATSGLLWTLDAAGHQADTQQKVAAGTSPAITALAGGGFEVVFASAADGSLQQIRADGTAAPLGSGPAVAAGTSPVVAGDVNGGFEAAYRAAGTGHLWTAGSASAARDTGAVVAAGSSPAILARGSGYVLVYPDGAGVPTSILPDGGTVVVGSGPAVAAGTSLAAAIPGDSLGRFETAYVAAGTGELWTVGVSGVTAGTGVIPAAHTSPAIATLGAGTDVIAYQADAGRELFTLTGTGPVDAHLSLGVRDSPVMAVTPLPPTEFALPSYAGLPVARAKGLVIHDQLTVGADTVDSSCQADAGIVTGQTPPAGTTAHLSDPVSLAVSSGTTAQGTPCHPVVPDVFGDADNTARSAITAQGLTPVVATGPSCLVGKGRVYDQHPDAGTTAQPGQAVTIVEATGKNTNGQPCITQ